MGPHHWSKNPEENQTSDPNAYVQKNWPAKAMGPAVRGLMATAACARDDSLGTLVAAVGANNVYSVSTNEGLIDPATQINGLTPAITKPFALRLAFDTALAGAAANVPHLKVDGFDCGPILRRDLTALLDDDLVTKAPVWVLGEFAAATDTKVTQVRVLDLVPSDVAALVPAGGTGPGQCRLEYVSPTQVVLKRRFGTQIFHNGSLFTIPAAGLPLANTGLLATSLPPATTYPPYYVYLKEVDDVETLIASTTGHVPDATYGHEVKSDDPTATLVGMVALDGTPGNPGTFADSSAKRYVASWFNRRRRFASSGQQEVTTSSLGQIELAPFRVLYLGWAGDMVTQCWAGSFSSATSVQTNWTRPYRDGAQIGPSVEFSFSGTGLVGHPSHTTMSSLTEGLHSSSIGVFTNSGSNVTWKGKQDAEVSI